MYNYVEEITFEEWRELQFEENFDDICSNLSIEIEDTKSLYADESLREIIIAEHDRQFPDTFTEYDFEDHLKQYVEDERENALCEEADRARKEV